ncbi:MAG: chromosome segregation protein SMC [gamma proteobacterium symbiont of Bathyaustriella thionipta]|nr:chromosome segregation protein SMC [gamma proteobacterium symbiont of Bathyaustriella thionipta]MCU7950718.1 chromosome segregation protein SMC [gamma proteobacterium symbiont of Bathyaustriella thionipta]MCU7952814.1 chromosome segregation protein SMC [gamma proteobacterium symbiont of Bathyaustriella thionipta]MCU7957134.1 chromosome segregation protein SMC [gamma proteobacterium symbiont of Bathyaustriella thionipta]MCU7968801.1 chromosome segregation protein SMC [gamma proteobacterium sy
MRLSKIKLAGFKSFVDPTVLSFPSDLVSILGPNGCGKSNTIDAVRWVMGESSAKNLRGESMTDVIFNGSSGRKPVGQCTVELLFDNSDGTLTGEYAKYNEISVKRTVNRDAQSQYFLNSVRCRRRDVTDLFLGTGLGPRSYSIIEQGMISRLIESKPEELRVYIEEAAGISKYKERRRETENRIRHTRENIERLDDIRLELDKQIAHLQRQARTAERYTELKKDERLKKAQLQALRWDAIDSNARQQDIQIREKEIALEQHISELRTIEAGIEESREMHIDANDAFNTVQGDFYRVGAEIARVEQAITHAKEKNQQYKNDLEQAERSFENMNSHLLDDNEKLESLNAQLIEIEPEFEQANELEEQSSQILADYEHSMQDWQIRWDEFNQQSQEPSQTAQIERSKISQFEQNISNYQQRIEKLQDEAKNLSTNHLDDSLTSLENELIESEEITNHLQQQLDQERENIQNIRDENHQSNNELDKQRSKLQSLQGRKASLEALQQAALGKNDKSLKQWMEHQHIADMQRIAEKISVNENWEQAVECVLGDYLEATCVETIEPLFQSLEALEKSNLTLIENYSDVVSTDLSTARLNSTKNLDLPLLEDYVDGSSQLIQPFLQGVYVSDDLSIAMMHRKYLNVTQSIITRDGIWIGPNWVRVIKDTDEKGGVLAREQELKELNEQFEQLQHQVEVLSKKIEKGRVQQLEIEHNRENLQTEFNQHNRKLSELRSQLSAKKSRLEQINSRQTRIEVEIEEIKLQSEEELVLIEESTERLHIALEMIDDFSQQRELLTQARETHRTQLEEMRIKARENRELSHALEIQLRGVKTEISSTEQGLFRLQGQLEQLSTRRQQLLEMMHEDDDPVQQFIEELETHLESRIVVEQQLSQARQKVEELEHALREFDNNRAKTENILQILRTELEAVRIASQELIVRRQTLNEQIDESGFSLEELFLGMPQEASESVWKTEVNDLAQRIQRLGSINLAAIDEFKEQSERKTYLDAQNEDLLSALDTLEGAIAKIDRETRTRFKETFDKINTGVQRLFPKLFGGGHAYLDLTGDDLLNTGVTIMARPPGKRNSTIHLLSGGEKAMTAVSLVFAIFELNPAPFCMLDEVDAPLDEANVGRFCAMVKEMSDQVQFIYITHNKTTMEMSEHLCGVTMKEPGVSRIVDVDIHEAVEMVES